MTDIIKQQILTIRNTGITNMFDVNTVLRIACELDFGELAEYLDEHRREYAHFILTGEVS